MEIIQYLKEIDTDLMLFLNYDGGAMMDQLWWIISGKFTWTPLYLYLLWLLYAWCRPIKVNWRKFTTLLILTVLVIVLSDQIASSIIKPWIMRPRPAQPDSGISGLIHIVHNYRGGHYGFVSSHAANTWGLSLWFILLTHPFLPCLGRGTKQTEKVPQSAGSSLPKQGGLGWVCWVLCVFTLLNCYSRIYLGVHYPGDILGGLIIGTLVAIFCFYVLLPLANRWIVKEN